MFLKFGNWYRRQYPQYTTQNVWTACSHPSLISFTRAGNSYHFLCFRACDMLQASGTVLALDICVCRPSGGAGV